MLRKNRNDARPRPDLEWEMCWGSKDDKAVTTWAFDDSWSTSYTDEQQLHQQSICPNRLKVICLVVPISFQVAPLRGLRKGLRSISKEGWYSMGPTSVSPRREYGRCPVLSGNLHCSSHIPRSGLRCGRRRDWVHIRKGGRLLGY